MKITTETKTYNERRYGRPWIARVDISKKAGGEFAFGQWIGDARNGGDGELILDGIEVGDIFARGQKDLRQPRKSAPHYYVLGPDGGGIACSSIVDARRQSAEIKATLPADADEPDLTFCTA